MKIFAPAEVEAVPAIALFMAPDVAIAAGEEAAVADGDPAGEAPAVVDEDELLLPPPHAVSVTAIAARAKTAENRFMRG